MSISKNEFMEFVGTEDVGFICHMFLDGAEYAIGAISPKDDPLKAMIKSSHAMMGTMCGKGMNFVRMTQEEYDLYKNEIEQKGMRQFRKDKLAEGLLKLDYWESK